MSTLRKILTPTKSDRMLMALLSAELLDAINTPLRTRGATLRLSYLVNGPALRINESDDTRSLWMELNTRTRKCIAWQPFWPPAGRIASDIVDRLAKLDAQLILVSDKPVSGPRIAKLQIHVADSRNICLTLAEARRGSVVSDLHNFEV